MQTSYLIFKNDRLLGEFQITVNYNVEVKNIFDLQSFSLNFLNSIIKLMDCMEQGRRYPKEGLVKTLLILRTRY